MRAYLTIYVYSGLLIKYTDEEVERSYEEFYEDVHTEFLKFGEIINFKVCRNGTFHLRGNVYVQYKSMDSAVMAYDCVHGRYFAGKQVQCEFVSLTRWKVAICGEYMKSRLKTCSRGSACNFLHCFSNPGGDYEWADFDKPPPRYWVKKMTALFGYSDERDQSLKDQQHTTRIFTSERDSCDYKRHRSVETSQHNGSSCRSYREERKSRHRECQDDNRFYRDEAEYKNNSLETDSDADGFDRKRHGDRSENHSTHISRESKLRDSHRRTRSRGSSPDEDVYTHSDTKRKSRHGKSILESSRDSKTEHRESESRRHKHQKTKSTRRRSKRHDDRDEVDDQESMKAKGRSQGRSRSHDSPDINDRWQPHSSKLRVYDDEMYDDQEPVDKRINPEVHSGRVLKDASKGVSDDHEDRTREKRKRI